MHWLKIPVLALAICLLLGVAHASQNNNICYTTHVGHCVEQVEWDAGWYWANNPPSVESCVIYHQLYTMGDFWGMCNGIDLPEDDDYHNNEVHEPVAGGGYEVALTNQWHALPEDGSNPCPWQGLDPIIDYEDGTFICATDF